MRLAPYLYDELRFCIHFEVCEGDWSWFSPEGKAKYSFDPFNL